MKFGAILAGAMVATAAGSAFELTEENFEDAMSDKNAFVKFLAPW
jgi:hypothetical protein